MRVCVCVFSWPRVFFPPAFLRMLHRNPFLWCEVVLTEPQHVSGSAQCSVPIAVFSTACVEKFLLSATPRRDARCLLAAGRGPHERARAFLFAVVHPTLRFLVAPGSSTVAQLSASLHARLVVVFLVCGGVASLAPCCLSASSRGPSRACSFHATISWLTHLAPPLRDRGGSAEGGRALPQHGVALRVRQPGGILAPAQALHQQGDSSHWCVRRHVVLLHL